MVTSAEWLALGTASIGVIGALAGSAITQAFANKREKRQWMQSRENQIQLWEREELLRFHNDKKIAYSAFIGKMHLWAHQMNSQLHQEYGGQAYGPDGFGEFETEVMAMMAQVELIAPPEVWTAAEVMWGLGAATALTLCGSGYVFAEKARRERIEFSPSSSQVYCGYAGRSSQWQTEPGSCSAARF